MKNNKENKSKNKSGSAKRLIVSVLLGIVVFIGLLALQKSILDEGAKIQTFMVKNHVDEGVLITEKNFGDLFKEVYVYEDSLPKGYIKSKHDAVGKYTDRALFENEILNKYAFCDDESKYYNNAHNPVQLTIAVDNISMAAGGNIQKGDVINIYGILKDSSRNTDLEFTREMVGVRVYGALDSAGNIISSNDKESKATMYAIFVDERDVTSIMELMKYYDITIVKANE